jgi:hypothetical protein
MRPRGFSFAAKLGTLSRATDRMATKKDLRTYRTATSYEHNNNLGADAVGVNRLEHLFIGEKRRRVTGIRRVFAEASSVE